MTPQEIFDDTAKWLLGRLVEGKGRVGADSREGFRCAYRTAKGEGCAVGRYIPDYAYDPAMENRGWRTVVNEGSARLCPSWLVDNVNLLTSLQDCHDLSDNWDHDGWMERALRNVAARYSLSASVVDQWPETR